MKKILLILGLLVSVTAARVVFAQSTTAGLITYEVKVNMHRRFGPDQQVMKERMPEYIIHKDQLFFNAAESLYKPVEEEEEEEDFAEDLRGGPRMRFRRLQAEHYFNQTTAKHIMLQDFMGKKFLIEDSITVTPWKLGTEIKTIQGYECKDARYYDEERKQNIVVWYTDKLRPFLGPEDYNSLPGTVLQVDINTGERIITAQKIEFRALTKSEMKIPTGGQRTTEEQFRKMMDEQHKRMGERGGMTIRN
jgi:GLPGLI family protein